MEAEVLILLILRFAISLLKVLAQQNINPNRNMQLDFGFQFIRYNRQIYRGDGDIRVNAFTPFVEWQHKFNKKMSYRIEVQYQYVPKDFGQWMYALVEFNVAPMFSVAVSDMWNFKPNQQNPKIFIALNIISIPYLRLDTYHATRVSLNYGNKWVELFVRVVFVDLNLHFRRGETKFNQHILMHYEYD